MKYIYLLIMILIVLISGCQTTESLPPEQDTAGIPTFTLTSPVFNEGEAIPEKYSCDGEDISPPLEWSEPPDDTASFALIMNDPDAPSGNWVHWVLYNIPGDALLLPEDAASGDALPGSSLHGSNSWNDAGYGGPCPPGGTHRYFFTLYALDNMLIEEQGISKQDLLDSLQGHILGAGQIMGTYNR